MNRIVVTSLASLALIAGSTLPAQAATSWRIDNDRTSDAYVIGYTKDNCAGTKHVIKQNGTSYGNRSFRSMDSGYNFFWRNGVRYGPNGMIQDRCYTIRSNTKTYN